MVTVRKYTALPLGRYWDWNLGSVMSGLVELGVTVAMSASDRIGEIALPSPLMLGPTAASTRASAMNFL